MPRREAILTSALALALASGPARAQDDLGVVIQYPPADATIGATDSTFVFGRVEQAAGERAEVRVGGVPAHVDPGGGWIAFVPLEPDSFTFEAVATTGAGRRAVARRTVWVPRPPTAAPAADTLGYRPETIEPVGPLELYPGDTLRVSVVAAPDLRVRARVGASEVALLPEPPDASNAGRLVFDFADPPETAWTTEPARASRGDWTRFAGDLFLTLSGAASDTLRLELTDPAGRVRAVPVAEIAFLDPTRVRTAVLDDDTAGAGGTDRRVIARHGAGAGYALFLPNGTRVALGRRAGAWREIVLGAGASAWAPLAEVHAIASARPTSRIRVIRTRERDGWSEIVIPTTERLPFRVLQELDPARYAITVYGALPDVDYVQTTFSDALVESIVWGGEPGTGTLQVAVRLSQRRAWGYRAYWEGTQLVVAFRHPPAALTDRRFRSALHGVRVVVDPGHNPDPGAVGPTGLEERQANLAIALELARLLERRGAQVTLTRATPDSALGLYERTDVAIRAGGELFVSIHNNALPDGVNPFVNNGTSVLYYHPQSRELAEAIQAQLLHWTGLPDRGVWHQNVAVLRMNEMPAVLVEAAFMMLPDQEAALRTPAFQRRIAEAVAAGIERYLDGGGLTR